MQNLYIWKLYPAQNAKITTSSKVALSTTNKGIYVKNVTIFLRSIKWVKR